MPPLTRFLVLAVLAAVPAVGAVAQPATDGASGLSVTPPPGYTAQPLPPNRGQAARFAVRMAADADTGCQVAFTPAPQNNDLSQAQLDAVMRGKAWQNSARTALSSIYTVTEATMQNGRARPLFVMVGDLKDRPGLPPRAKEIRTLFVLQESPRGRTSVVCVGDRSDFTARRAGFMAVVAGVNAP